LKNCDGVPKVDSPSFAAIARSHASSSI
jgi:hypothetical protein